MEGRLPRKLAAILYADVAGYSRLTGDDEDNTHRTLRAYLTLISSRIEENHGQSRQGVRTLSRRFGDRGGFPKRCSGPGAKGGPESRGFTGQRHENCRYLNSSD